MNNILIRPATDTDWPSILELVNILSPQSEPENRQWWLNRQKFDAQRYSRRHYVAQSDDRPGLLAYAGLEEGPDRRQYRLFILLSPDLLPSLGERLFLRLSESLLELAAHKVWAWEEEGDPMVNFLLAHGFEERSHLTLPDLRKSLFLAKELLTAS
jgi:N-acetylglutamate synthase-like GNAT family acetyltransferase